MITNADSPENKKKEQNNTTNNATLNFINPEKFIV